MFYKNNHIRKAISAGMLIVLLLIHSVKLLHSHPGNHISNAGWHTTFAKNYSAENLTSSNDCGVCNYHLTKDADGISLLNFCDDKIVLPDFQSSLISPSLSSVFYTFNTRGPPQTV